MSGKSERYELIRRAQLVGSESGEFHYSSQYSQVGSGKMTKEGFHMHRRCDHLLEGEHREFHSS